MTVEEMQWDLSQLVKSDDPNEIEKELDAAVVLVQKFHDYYAGKIANLDAKGVFEFLEEGDDMELKLEGVMMYSMLMYQADSTTDLAKKLYDKYRRASMAIQQNMVVLQIELGKLLSEKPEIVEEPVIEEYKHFLEKILRAVPHMLSAEQEQLTIIKDKNGIRAWQMIQGDWLSTRKFDIEVEGEAKTMPYGEIVALYEHADRDVRRLSNHIVYENLGKDEILWASAVRAICADHIQMCKLRKHPAKTSQSLIANDLDQATLDSLMKTIEKNVEVYRKYLKIKAKIMGFKKLGNWDIMAPLPNAPEMKYTWNDARKEVVAAYTEFDGEIGGWIDEMYELRHIDGEVRNGKRSGAFCANWHDGKSAYILQSFNGMMGDVFTQAHELGHAAHAYLGARAQKPSNYEIGASIAEVGSIFGELLLTERLLAKVKSKEETQAILATVLDGAGFAAFQVSARFFFEQSMYDAIEAGEFLDGETVAALWTAGRDKIYGDSVEWLPEMKWEWTMKVHYYMPKRRFYNYPYVFAQLLVYALYRLYKEQGKEFVPKLKTILSAGSSRSPRDLAADVGFDITTEEFWQKGIDQYAEFTKMLEDAL
ncbi:MAG: M3 family metallopeptidase [Candidatus Thorarchaeota archaeon]